MMKTGSQFAHILEKGSGKSRLIIMIMAKRMVCTVYVQLHLIIHLSD